MVPSSRSIRQLTMSPAAQDCRKEREEVKHVFPRCSHITIKTATQPIPRDSGLKKREFLLPAAHSIFRHFWKLHIKPLTGIFFPSSTGNVYSSQKCIMLWCTTENQSLPVTNSSTRLGITLLGLLNKAPRQHVQHP